MTTILEFGEQMTGRNRSQGWSHAKHSGHALEERIGEDLKSNRALSSEVHQDCFGAINKGIPTVHGGGKKAKKVPCVLGGTTTPKADLTIEWRNRNIARLSLKKSRSGQVWLVTPERFFEGFEKLFAPIPDSVKKGIRMFIGPISEKDMNSHASKCTLSEQEKRQKRLVSKSLVKVIPSDWQATLDWIRSNLPQITEMCFSTGLCTHAGRAGFIMYHIIDDASQTVRESRIIPIPLVVQTIKNMQDAERAQPGPKNGGSTIILPFGFVQMHDPGSKGNNQIQFHHKMASIKRILKVT